MKTILLFITAVIALPGFCCTTDEYSGIRLKTDGDQPCVINANNYCMHPVDTNLVDTGLVVDEIQNSDLADKAIIIRTLSMYSDNSLKLVELLKLACTYGEVSGILLRHVYDSLSHRYKPAELNKLLRKKP